MVHPLHALRSGCSVLRLHTLRGAQMVRSALNVRAPRTVLILRDGRVQRLHVSLPVRTVRKARTLHSTRELFGARYLRYTCGGCCLRGVCMLRNVRNGQITTMGCPLGSCDHVCDKQPVHEHKLRCGGRASQVRHDSLRGTWLRHSKRETLGCMM